MFSPLTVKRFKAFRRIRRAWWSLMGLAGIFVFTMFAEFVCPCDPREVVDPATLEKYRRPAVEKVYEIRSARFNLMDDGTLAEWEGPEDVKAAVRKRAPIETCLTSGGVIIDRDDIVEAIRDMYNRKVGE
jgi:hypothetical protein